MRMGEAQFQKNVYGREKKRRLRQMEDFDPRHVEFRGTARDRLPQLLEKLRGEQLCISLLFDEHFRHWDSSKTPEAPTLPDITCLKESVTAFSVVLLFLQEISAELSEKRRSKDTHRLGSRQDDTESRHLSLVESFIGSQLHLQIAWCCKSCSQNSSTLQQLIGASHTS